MENLGGKAFVVTGANSGIGKAAAIELARHGGRVLITARDETRGRAALEEIRTAASGPAPELFIADFASLDDVRRLAEKVDAACAQIDVLVNNAGVILSQRQVSRDGLEMVFQVNHLAPFLLTTLLEAKLKASAARVVNTSSAVHTAGGPLDFDDLMHEKSYKGFPVYGRSKLCNILFSNQLSRRFEGTGATSNALHPGVVNTGFAGDGDTKGAFSMFIQTFRPFFRTPLKGAETTLFLATSPKVAALSGRYFANCKEKKPAPYAVDPQTAARLWHVSEALCESTRGSSQAVA